MEAYWFPIIVSLCIAALIKSAITTFSSLWNTQNAAKHLPPGPPSLPLIGNLIWLRKPISDLEAILRGLKPRYGPLITMKIGPRPFIFIGSHSLAHRALVQDGAVFSDRPANTPVSRILNPTQISVSSAAYGPTWRLLRRNLNQEILNPARVKSHSGSRRWVLSLLVNRLRTEHNAVRLIDHFQYAMFCLLVLMCFGDRLGEEQIKEIEAVQQRLLLGFRRFNALNMWPPWLAKFLFRSRWNEFTRLWHDQENVLLPLIRARIQAKQQHKPEDDDESAVAYVDSLANLQLPQENNRKLQDREFMSLCSEFLSAGTDTTSTALQWIMANLIKYPEIQAKLYHEIVRIVGPPRPVVTGEHLAVVVEEDESIYVLETTILERYVL